MAPGNKLELTNSADLAREEDRISKQKAKVLFVSGMLHHLEAGKRHFPLCPRPAGNLKTKDRTT